MSDSSRPGYKKTDIGEIPKEWDIKTLSDKKIIIKVKAGGTPLRTKKEYWEGGDIPFVRIEDITGNKKYLRHTAINVTKSGIDNSSAWIVPINSVLLSMYASYGETIINKIPVSTNQAIIALLPNEDNLHLEYLFYSLKYLKHHWERFIRETTQKNINAQIVKKFSIPLPSLREQYKIADILSTVDDAIQKTEAIITKTDELKKGLMQRLLTRGIGHTLFKKTEIGEIPEEWDVARLGDISSHISSGITPRGGEKNYLNRGIPFIRSQNVFMNNLSFEEIAYISEDTHNSMKNSEVKPGDILLNITGASIGRVAYCPDNIEKANVNQHVCRIRLQSDISSKFVTLFISSNKGQKQILSFQGGSTRQGLNYNQAKSLFIIIPPIAEQQKIAGIFSIVDKKKEIGKLRKQKLLELKKGLMQVLLTGEVRVKVGEDA